MTLVNVCTEYVPEAVECQQHRSTLPHGVAVYASHLKRHQAKLVKTIVPGIVA